MSNGKPRPTVFKHDEMIHAATFSPDGKTLATGGSQLTGKDNSISLWDVETGKKTATLPGPTLGVDCLAFSPDSRFLVSTGHGDVTIWKLEGSRPLATWEAHPTKGGDRTGVHALAFFPDGKTLATGGFGFDSSVKIWDVSAVLAAK
jgi:WD40 repeat protein